MGIELAGCGKETRNIVAAYCRSVGRVGCLFAAFLWAAAKTVLVIMTIALGASDIAWGESRISTGSSEHGETGGIAHDKILHFSVSALIASTTSKLARDVGDARNTEASAIALGATVLLGGCKEFLDARGGGAADVGDMTANLLGAAYGVALQWDF